ncbi:hypothetical protein QYS32_16475 [Klebsiella pneumoniae]|nr:hypothetical protein [Klebsiella pneumoniae]MDS6702852.1 hypothetical protein [Klebsiella pneumoniae]
MNTIDQFCRNTKGVQFLQRRFEVLLLLFSLLKITMFSVVASVSDYRDINTGFVE